MVDEVTLMKTLYTIKWGSICLSASKSFDKSFNVSTRKSWLMIFIIHEVGEYIDANKT